VKWVRTDRYAPLCKHIYQYIYNKSVHTKGKFQSKPYEKKNPQENTYSTLYIVSFAAVFWDVTQCHAMLLWGKHCATSQKTAAKETTLHNVPDWVLFALVLKANLKF